jgi:hypothetical protein
MAADDCSDHFVPWLAYSTGLIVGWVLVDIAAHLIGAHPREGNRMSNAKAEVSELLDDLPEDCTPAQAEHVRLIRSKILRGDADYEAGRMLTHEEFRARMAPWVGELLFRSQQELESYACLRALTGFLVAATSCLVITFSAANVDVLAFLASDGIIYVFGLCSAAYVRDSSSPCLSVLDNGS